MQGMDHMYAEGWRHMRPASEFLLPTFEHYIASERNSKMSSY